MGELKSTDKYKHYNHYHELTDDYSLVDFGDGEFVANNKAIPLLKELSKLGLKTRTHHISDDSIDAFVSILINPDVSFLIRQVNERDRTMYNGKSELLISWKLP